METQPNAIVTLFESGVDYVETRLALMKLEAVDKSADVASSLVSRLLIAIVAVMAFVLVNFGLSYWIGSLLGAAWMGFMVVGGFYLLLTVLLIAGRRKWLKHPINDLIVKKLLN